MNLSQLAETVEADNEASIAASCSASCAPRRRMKSLRFKLGLHTRNAMGETEVDQIVDLLISVRVRSTVDSFFFFLALSTLVGVTPKCEYS